MIELTAVNGHKYFVNRDQVVAISIRPDNTVAVHFASGEPIVVKEPFSMVAARFGIGR